MWTSKLETRFREESTIKGNPQLQDQRERKRERERERERERDQ